MRNALHILLLLSLGLLISPSLQAQDALIFPLQPEAEFIIHGPQPTNLAIVKSKILYPKQALLNNREGKVMARIWVNSKGRYYAHEILDAPDPSFANAVASALPDIAFEPAVLDGVTQAGVVVLPFYFRLED